MNRKLLLLGCLHSALLLTGCSKPAPEQVAPEPKAQPTVSRYSEFQTEVDALAAVGLSSEEVGRFKLVTFDAAAFSAKQSELMARIRADSTLTGTDSSGQKAELLNKCNQAYSTAQAQPQKSKEEVKAFILAYGGNATSDSDVQHAVIKLWGSDALKELIKADNVTIGDVVRRVLT